MLTHPTALILTAILITSIPAFTTIVNAQQEGSDGGLTAKLNGNSFTTGDTITVSGTVGEHGPRSSVSIEVMDPKSILVESELTPVSAGNGFIFSFVAGPLELFDPDHWMLASGNYKVVVRYTPPGPILEREVVELSFEYAATSDITAGATTTEEATTSDITSEGRATNVTAINQSIAQATRYTELAYNAMQNNDTQDVFTNLNLILNELESIQGNLTTLTPPD